MRYAMIRGRYCPSLYNEALHIYADPDVEGGWGRGRGFEGDYELVAQQSTSPDTLYFRGKITGNVMRMFKPKQGTRQYLKSVRTLRSSALNIDELLTNNTDAWVGKLGGKDVVLYFDRGDYNRFFVDYGDGFLISTPYTYTDTGVKLMTPINGVNVLSWDAKNKVWTSPAGETLALRKDPYYGAYTKYLGTYTLHNLFDSEGKKIDPIEVDFVERKGLTYTIRPKSTSDMSYKLVAEYDKERDAFTLQTQMIETSGSTGESFVLMPTNAKTGAEFLQTFMLMAGMVSSLEADHALSTSGDVYTMGDNGNWTRAKVASFVVVRMFLGSWSVAKDVKPTILHQPIFVKHK